MNEFLTQSQLAERLVQKTGIRLETAKKFSTVFFTIVRTGLKDSETFSVYNFGTFKKTWIEATVGLNPGTGEKINIPAHWRIKFIPCSRVAKRLNKKYEHLKAKEVPEDTVLPDETPTSSIPVPVVQAERDDDRDEDLGISEDEIDEVSNDSDDADEVEITKNNFKLIALAGVGLLFLILLFSLLIKACSSKTEKKDKKAKADTKVEQVEVKEEAEAEEPELEISDEKTEEELELEAASLMFASFAVPDGSDYHTIAEEKYGNRHLWPVLFAANKDLSSDPDFVAKYRNIKIPELPAGENERNAVITSSVLQAYNAYLLMCEKEPESSKNPERNRLAVRVLVSGELLVPGFIESNRNRILPDYAQMAQNIVLHQYK